MPLRVVSPLLALNAGKSKLVEIPVGSTIDTLVELSHTDDLVELGFHRVRYEGQELLAFTKHIRERTE
jgi:hypothetical protein